jgi:DNA-binding response OmpR family regulator
MRNRCILVVDDDDRVRDFIRHVLQNEQFAVIDFADSNAAIEALPAFRDEISAIISDADFARKLARNMPHLPILMISGANEPFVEEPGLCFLGKPFGPRTLVRALRGLMNASRQLVPA